jgi:type VI secretion system protein ImpB
VWNVSAGYSPKGELSMATESSVAPKERVNIVYKSATGNNETNVELPFKQVVIGQFTSEEGADRLEDKKPISINKDNFNDVLNAHKVNVQYSVPNTLSKDPDGELNVSLNFNTMEDFGPEKVAQAVPELDKLLKLREALIALKRPLNNIPEFRKKIQNLIDDVNQREKLLAELGLETK